MTAFHFPVFAPAIVKKGESVKIVLGSIPASGETVEVYIVDPSGRTLKNSIQIKKDVGNRTYLSSYYFNFKFPSTGTFTIYAWISTPPTPDISMGVCVVHVPVWLEKIDAPISDIAKQSTNIQRLKTNIDRRG